MVEQFQNRAKEILRISWSESRDRALHLLFFFFAVAAFFSYYESLLKSKPHYLVQLFALQTALVVILLFLLAKSYRPLLKTHVKWFLLTLTIYFAGLWTLDLLAGLFFEAQSSPLRHVRTEDWVLSLILAPILEELFFRDYLFRSLSENGRRLWFAMLISTVFFTLAHFSLYPGAFLLGLINCYLFVMSGGVLLPIVFHFACNLSWYLLPVCFPRLLAFLESNQIRDFFYR